MGVEAHTATEYRDALLALLPQGRIWDEERENPDGELYRLCQVWGQEYAALEAELLGLTREASPLTATKTLDDWVKSTGTSPLEGRKPIQRARTVAALLGSYASSLPGLAAIAQMMDYELTFEPIYPQGKTAIGPRYGQMRCGDRLWGTSYGLHRRLSIRSDREDFRVLKERIDSQKIALCATLHCGDRLWQNNTDIQTIANISLYEIKTIEGLLPAHFIVERTLA